MELKINEGFSVKFGDVEIITADEAVGLFAAIFKDALPEAWKPYAEESLLVGDTLVLHEHAARMWKVVMDIWDGMDKRDPPLIPEVSLPEIPWDFLLALEKTFSLHSRFFTDLRRTKVVLQSEDEELEIEPTPTRGFTFSWFVGAEIERPSLKFLKVGVYDLVAEQELGTLWQRLKAQLEALAAERCGGEKVEIAPA